MAVTKKRKIQASEIEVGNRTLVAVLADAAERSVRAEERSVRAEERSVRAEERSVRAEEMAAEAAARSARAEERSAKAFETLTSLLQDFRAFAGRAEGRLDTLEKAVGA